MSAATAALGRADHTWCKTTADERLDTARLEHLAAAVAPLVDQTASSPPDDPEVEQLHTELDNIRETNGNLWEETDRLRAELEDWKRRAAELDDLLAAARADSQRRVDHAVQATQATISVLQDKIRDLRIDVAAAKRELVATEPADLIAAAVADVRAEASLQRDADQRILHDAHEARDHYRTALARVVAAAVGDWHDTDDPIRQADTAVDLIHRVIEAFTAHRHAYEYRGPTKPPGPCLVAGCGKPYPSGKGRVA